MSSPTFVPGHPVEADRQYDKEPAEGYEYGRKYDCEKTFGHYDEENFYCKQCAKDIKEKCMEKSKLRPEFTSDEDKKFPSSMLSSSIGQLSSGIGNGGMFRTNKPNVTEEEDDVMLSKQQIKDGKSKQFSEVNMFLKELKTDMTAP